MSLSELYTQSEESLKSLTVQLHQNLFHKRSQLLNVHHTYKQNPPTFWISLSTSHGELAPVITLLALVSCVTLSFIFVALFTWRKLSGPLENEKARKRALLKKLFQVFVPARSVWSEKYWTLARESVKSQKCVLPLRSLMDEIIQGDMEIRDPKNHLPQLLLGRLTVHGLTILLFVEHALFRQVWYKTWLTRASVCQPDQILRRRHPSTVLVNSDSSSLATGITLYLDRVPIHALQSFMNLFKTSISPGSTAILGFSSRGIAFPTSQRDNLFIFASVPFLRSPKLPLVSKIDPPKKGPRGSLRTTIPLHTKLESVVSSLTSGTIPLVVREMRNISDDYATHLDVYADQLVNDERIRTGFQRKWGLGVWREELLVTQWESALLRAQVLERWAITVERRAY